MKWHQVSHSAGMAKMKKLVLIAVPLLLVLGGAAFLMLRPGPPPPDEKALAKEPAEVYTMPTPFVVNLADRDARRFAKVGLALEVSALSAGLLEEGPKEEPVHVDVESELRDIVLGVLQTQTAAQLPTAVGREKVRKAILMRVNAETELKITNVFFTELAVQ